MALTPKQQMFVKEYLIDLNATQAAIRAGYSEKTAAEQASRLLNNVNVASRIEEEKNKRADKLGLTAEWVLENLHNIAVRCQQAEPVMKWDYNEKKLIETGEFQFDSKGANRALELIGKHLAMFTDKVDNSGKLVFEIKRPDDA